MPETPMKLTNESGEWEYVPFTDEEVAAMNAEAEERDLDIGLIRGERNGLLEASDWTQLADAPVDATTWATYRQELRDLPAAFDRVSDVVWPTPPA